jgi:hypothetical protein
MAMSLSRINALLRENGVSSIVFPLNMPEKQQTLLIPLESGLNFYLLELRQDGEKKSWTLSDGVNLPSSVMSE